MAASRPRLRPTLRRRGLWICGTLWAMVMSSTPLARAAEPLPAYTVVGDAIAAPLARERGNATRGRGIVGNRTQGLCLLCHSGPFPDPHLQGTLAPPLAQAVAGLSEGQLRLRLVDPQRLKPESIMPAYGRSEGFTRPARALQGKPLLDAQQIEDVVAFLRTLQ